MTFRESGAPGRRPLPTGWRKDKRRLFVMAALALAAFVVAPQYIRAYRIHGPSDAPTYLWGDLILVNRAAYDLRVPFTELSMVRTGSPRRGDVVLLRLPDNAYDITRRVIGLPGDTVEVRESRVVLNGEPLTYSPIESSMPATVDPRNKIGAIVERERGAGPDHPITYTPGACGVATTAPIAVPPGHYFVMGDNRDHCTDSRRIGAVARDRFRGKVVRTLRSAR